MLELDAETLIKYTVQEEVKLAIRVLAKLWHTSLVYASVAAPDFEPLIRADLITITPKNEDFTVCNITDRGRAYLLYHTAMALIAEAQELEAKHKVVIDQIAQVQEFIDLAVTAQAEQESLPF